MRRASDPFDPTEPIQFDSETETYRGRFDSTVVAPSTAVVEVVAAVCDAEPTELPPLYDAVDPEALDRQCTGRPTSRRDGDRIVEFAYHDHRVRVKSYGIVEVTPLEAASRGAEEEETDERG